VRFGDLTLDDYASAVAGALDGLAAHWITPGVALGHSMGGMTLQLLQQRLLDQGTSLHRRFGIRGAVLLASTAPREVAWALADNGTAEALLGAFLATDPVLGTFVRVPPAAWQQLFFTNTLGVLASGAPSTAEIVARGYISDEPFAAGAELIGAGPLDRPSVRGGIFAVTNGTVATVVAFEQDAFLRPAEEQALYVHLTGDTRARGYRLVSGSETVHDTYISDPTAIIRELSSGACAAICP
jgi:pimeloyl-ACP methyl ester carboxylesterase